MPQVPTNNWFSLGIELAELRLNHVHAYNALGRIGLSDVMRAELISRSVQKQQAYRRLRDMAAVSVAAELLHLDRLFQPPAPALPPEAPGAGAGA